MGENTQEKEVQESTETKSSMKYVVFGAILLVVLGGAGYFMTKGNQSNNEVGAATETARPKPKGPPSLKGQKFSDTDLFSNAVQIAPGALSEEAKAITSGWQVKSRSLADGTTQVDLVPVGSEATEGDTAHTFNIKKEYKLYFADLNPGDDSSGSDNNKNDDIGILVDGNGIIQ